MDRDRRARRAGHGPASPCRRLRRSAVGSVVTMILGMNLSFGDRDMSSSAPTTVLRAAHEAPVKVCVRGAYRVRRLTGRDPADGSLGASRAWATPSWTSSRCASAATCSAGRSTRSARSRCSTRTCAAGGNFIDTADTYGRRGPGGAGESSSGSSAAGWPRAATASELVIATKVGRRPDAPGLSRGTIRAGAEASLERLRHRSHRPLLRPPGRPARRRWRRRCGAFGALIDEGKIRYAAASNYSARAPRAGAATSASATAWPLTSRCSPTTT